MYLKNLLLLRNYQEAENILNQDSHASTNQYYKACTEIIYGILNEKKYHNYNLAKDFYNRGIQDLEVYGSYGNEFRAYGYFGLSRISELKGEKENKRKFHREAMDLVSFKKINFNE